jgi:hypothetical protein
LDLQQITTDLLTSRGAFADLGLNALAVPVGIVTWLVIVFWPLRGVDRRDNMAGVTFVLFATAAAALMVLAVPRVLAASGDGTLRVATLGLFASAAAVRWLWRRSRSETLLSLAADEGEPSP